MSIFSKKKLKYFSFIVILILLFSELLVRFFKPQITYTDAFKFAMNCLTKDDLLPFSLIPGFKNCSMVNQDGDFSTTANINSLGYRGKDFLEKKVAGSKRILVLGDSITFGIGVPDDKTYPYLLEEKLKSEKKVAVINAGYTDGFSPDSYYVYLKNMGEKLKPDIIILGFFVWNDISDISERVWEKTDPLGLPEKVISCCRRIVDGYLQRNNINFKYQLPILRQSHLYLTVIEELPKKFNLFQEKQGSVPKRDLLQGCVLNPSCIDNFHDEEEKTYKLLEAIDKYASWIGSKFLLVIFPVDLQYYPDRAGKYVSTWFPDPKERDFIQNRMKKRLNSLGIKYLDLYDVFDKEKDKINPFFIHDAHLNIQGHEIAAREIANYLQSYKLLDPDKQ